MLKLDVETKPNTFKGELGELQIYFRKINKYFWWFPFFLIRLGC